MPSNWKLILPRHPCLKPTPQPRAYYYPRNPSQSRPKSSATKPWTGSSGPAHSVAKAHKRDHTDPEASGSEAGMKEREESYGIANHTKSHATTERDGLHHQRKAKKENPKAPEPIIGMNDERAEVGT